MSASKHIGRIGGLAVALGLGAAVFANDPVANALPNTSDQSGSSVSGADANDEPNSAPVKTRKGPLGIPTPKGNRSGGSTTPADTTPRTRGSDTDTEDPPKRGTSSRKDDRLSGLLSAAFGGHQSSPSSPSSPSSTSRSESKSGSDTTTDSVSPSKGRGAARTSVDTAAAEQAPPRPTWNRFAFGPTHEAPTTNDVSRRSVVVPTPDVPAVPTIAPATVATTLRTAWRSLIAPNPPSITPPTVKPAVTMSTVLSELIEKVTQPTPGNAPTSPAADPPFAWVLAAAVRRELSGLAVTDEPQSPTVVLNGSNVVATSPERVLALYGMFTNPPAVPGVVQGDQSFEVVNPDGATAGTFDALISNYNSDVFGGKYVQLLVTSADGDVGTGAGQVPPVGSVIAANNYGGFGISYTAMPSDSGDVVKLDLVTPFGNLPLPTTFDAAAGIADRSVDNRPVDLANGYYIAPANPVGEEFTAITGLPPLFVALQGDQVFNVYESGSDVPVGSFVGHFTTTGDVLGTYTQAILVTENVTGTVGTAAGQVPPPGTVYNVIYWGRDNTYSIYSSMPSSAGDLISFKNVSPFGVTPIDVTFDASAPSPIQTLSVPGSYSFVPTSDLKTFGVNGLPPREVQIQGYRQFAVTDAQGNPIGSVDADVTTQTDIFGNTTVGLLVTKATDQSGAGDVPPAGSVFNFLYSSISGLGFVYSAIPSASGNIVTYRLVTPFGTIPIPTVYDAAAGMTDYELFDPFDPTQV